jgi:integrase
MSSLHADKRRLFVSFVLRLGDQRTRVRLYLGLRDTRENRRSALTKEVREMIELRRWAELAERFPQCKALASFRPAIVVADASTFEQVSDRFLAYHGNVNKQATVDFYRTILKSHVWPVRSFAEKPIKLIGASDAAAVYGAVNAKGHQAQAANVRRVISAASNWARGERSADGEYLVSDNPVNRTRPVVAEEAGEAIDPFTAEEIQRIVAAARDGWERRIIVVAFGSGLDPGENFGLKRSNLDFAGRKIQVRQRFTRYGAGGLKNKRRRREVDISEPVYRALREQVAATELRSPWLWPVSITDSQPHDPQRFSGRNWKGVLKRAGVKHRAFYQCRHSFATLLLRGGADWQYVADQMGHLRLSIGSGGQGARLGRRSTSSWPRLHLISFRILKQF